MMEMGHEDHDLWVQYTINSSGFSWQSRSDFI